MTPDMTTHAQTRRTDRRLAGAIVSWFAENARALPWRSRRSGYTALVSEIMLQQTQVDRVEPRYRAFLKRFPSVQSLAEADEADVLKAWEGLGYYRRARMLHAAARIIVSDMGGRIPRNLGELRRLPGVGRYTAGAICSIVHGQKTAIVDGNIARLLARIDGVHLPRGEQAFDTWCWKRAQTLVDASDDPARFNEGMMELGAVVCTPRSPRCRACPARTFCIASQQGIQEDLPVRAARSALSAVHHHAVIITRGSRILVERRPDAGLWAGLWQTPTIESVEVLPARVLPDRLPIAVSELSFVDTFEHRTTRRAITFHVYTARSRARKGRWRTVDEIDALPMSNAHRKVLARLESV